ncbi:MAG TPA: hypothetical protein VH723_00375 [Candidatus Limnocylindrales bacterium]
MRGCLGVLVLAAAFVAAAAWFGGPPVAGSLVEGAIVASGFESRTRTVVVLTDPPVEVVGGHADRIAIGADDASFEDIRAQRLDVTLFDVDLLRSTFGRIDGRLTGATMIAADGTTTAVESIGIIGPPSDVVVTVRVDGTVVDQLARGAVVRETGLAVDSVALEPPATIAFLAGPVRMDGLLAVDATGALTVALPLPGDPIVDVLAPGGSLALTAVSVDAGDLVLIGRVDLEPYLR